MLITKCFYIRMLFTSHNNSMSLSILAILSSVNWSSGKDKLFIHDHNSLLVDSFALANVLFFSIHYHILIKMPPTYILFLTLLIMSLISLHDIASANLSVFYSYLLCWQESIVQLSQSNHVYIYKEIQIISSFSFPWKWPIFTK